MSCKNTDGQRCQIAALGIGARGVAGQCGGFEPLTGSWEDVKLPVQT